jgi:hypothetical protein
MKIKLATIGVLVMLQVTAWASTDTVVWNFGGSGDGNGPTGNLIADASGNFWGAGGTDGGAPVGQLIQDKQNNLYGTRLRGGTRVEQGKQLRKPKTLPLC